MATIRPHAYLFSTTSSDNLDDACVTDVDEITQTTPKRLRSMTIRDFGQYAGRGTGPQFPPGSDVVKPPGQVGQDEPSNPDHSIYEFDLDHRDVVSPDYYDAFEEFPPSTLSPNMSASVPQLPPVPISPISPRWDSLFHGNPPIRYDSSSVSDRSTSMESNPRVTAGARSQTSAFPGLSSHPVSADHHGPVPTSPSFRNFSLLDSNAGAYYRPITPSSSTTKSFTDNSPSRDGPLGIENFSRPRKPSLRQGSSELHIPRQRTGTMPEEILPETDEFMVPDQHSINAPLNPAAQHSGWHRGRGYSTSSARSSNTTNTHTSVVHQPSHDQLGGTPRTASVRRGPPSSNMNRSPLAHNEGSAPSTARESPPWITAGNDELRSSFRSQLTASTALGTVFTVNGTERSSVLTKASSVTGSLIIDGYARASVVEEDGLSVEDVMGMYADGFHDDSDEDDTADMDKDGPEDENNNDRQEFRPGQAQSHQEDVLGARPGTGDSKAAGRLVDQMLEAMTDPLPIPGAAAGSSSGLVIARDSGAFFRNSGLPSSLPKDVGGFGSAAHRFGIRTVTSVDNFGTFSTPQAGFATSTLRDEQDRPDIDAEVKSRDQLDELDDSIPVPKNLDSRPSSRAQTPMKTSQPPQEAEEDPSSRDRYGFRKANQYITREQYDTWDASYTEYLARRRKKWVAYLKDSSLMTDEPDRFPPRSAKTKRFVRKGIPPDWRGAAWFYYAGGPKILAKHPGVYDEMVRGAGLEPAGSAKAVPEKCALKPIIVEDIEKDLHRTFPDNVRFRPPRSGTSPTTTNPRPQASSPVGTEDSQATLTDQRGGESSETEAEAEPEIISSLRRVLHAFALYNPRIGYCQSLNFLAGLLLLFVESEEHAFWLLNVITRVYLPGTHEMSLEGSKVDLGVLMATLKDALPSVWKQIGGDDTEMASRPGPKKAPTTTKAKRFRDISNPAGSKTTAAAPAQPADPNHLPAITLCMTAWFMSCFIGTLPIETVLRVWDIFFYEGSRTLFRIALTIFKVGEAEIKAVADPMEMFGVVQTLPRRMLDPNALLEACYRKRNNFRHLSQDLVEEKRLERRDAIRRWKAAQEKAAAAGAADSHDEDASASAAIISATTKDAAGLDLAAAADMADLDGFEVRRKGTIFGKRKVHLDRERARAEEVL